MNTTQNIQRITATALIAVTAGLALSSCGQGTPGESLGQVSSARVARLTEGHLELAERRAEMYRELADQRAAELRDGLSELAERRAEMLGELADQRAAGCADPWETAR